MKLFPDLAEPFFQMAKYELSEGQFRKAIPFLQQAIEKAPELTQAHMYMALVYIKTDQIRNAKSILQTGLEYKPDYPDYYILMGDLYGKTNEPQKGIDAFEQAIKIDRNNQETLQKLISFLEFEGQTEKVRKYCQMLKRQ